MDYLKKCEQLKIVDATCGKGKTSWAIQHMYEVELSEKFIYITPFLTEVQRVKESVTSRKFYEPTKNDQNVTKLESLKHLLEKGENIVATHSLFLNADDEILKLIFLQDYTLILDEVMNVIEQVPIKQDDIKVLLKAKTDEEQLFITVKENGYVKWNHRKYNGDRFSHIKHLSYTDNLIIYNDIAMYWTFPAAVFKSFKDVYILTYMFYGQLQRYYFDLFKVKYKFLSVDLNTVTGKYELTQYVRPTQEKELQELREKIRIYYKGLNDKKDLNAIGEEKSAFSSSWIKRYLGDKSVLKMITDSAYNFHRNKCQSKSDKVMWTCVKEFEKKLAVPKAKKQFVEVTCRATNNYVERDTLIYLANRYMNPVTKQFFKSHNIRVDEDLWALSELIQWLFRSAIRKEQPINLYIPSSRMRELLEKYLSGESVAWFEKIFDGMMVWQNQSQKQKKIESTSKEETVAVPSKGVNENLNPYKIWVSRWYPL
ncbi:hypothetical protein [Metabacillus dongyingensis]|uniref:hypothetical protein n=1 Tax=Metabacillus dongyingensis TaxID=2874282 RepID=UPI001CBED5CA|nr:hypothetical protein [Metabacillus dongyingensis]UAL54466.1 hypothetical protein K8L98_12165 [Metabacillus dongyingensis]